MTKRAYWLGGAIAAIAAIGVGAYAWFGFEGDADPADLARYRKVADFALHDQKGDFHRLYKYGNSHKVVVLYTQGVACPVVRLNVAALQDLEREFGPQGVAFLMLNANPQDDRAALAKEAGLLKIAQPILKDEAQLVAEALEVERTGEAIVIDTRTWTIRYRGPVDDRTPAFEAQKDKPAHRYLAEAIGATLKRRKVAFASPPPQGIGCAIDIDRNPKATISYAKEIVPILRERCMGCHRPRDIAPWSMDSYEVVKGWSRMMREVIATKRMPPWHADPQIGRFEHERRLTSAEEQKLVHWIDAGAPRGNEGDPLKESPPAAAEEWPLGKPDMVIDVPRQAIPALGNVDYRYVKVPVQVDGDKWVRAVQLKPSNRAAMHHGFVFVEYPAGFKGQQPNWAKGVGSFFAYYVPGTRPEPLPENSGQFLPKGAVIEFQLHYIAIGTDTVDEPQLALYFHKTPPKLEHVVASAYNGKISIPPHAAHHPEKAEATLKDEAMLYSLLPHMHYRGSQFRFTAHYPDGRDEALLSVPNYVFNWQTQYHLKEPRKLPAGTRIKVEAVFDNSKDNPFNPNPAAPVGWGTRTVDEMMIGYYMYTRPRHD